MNTEFLGYRVLIPIEINEKCIENGESRSEISCPIALALKNAGFKNPVVTPISLSGIFKSRHYFIPLNKDGKAFVSAFDWSGARAVKPFTFMIEIGDENG